MSITANSYRVLLCQTKSWKIEELTCGDIRKSAILITHYHSDHIGKISELQAEIPIYMGRIAKEITSRLANHLSGVSEKHRKMAERLNTVITFTHRKRFNFGEFEIYFFDMFTSELFREGFLS